MPIRKLLDTINPFSHDPDDLGGPQYGTIPYRIVDDRVVFLMITSRRSANWVFPKGSLIKGLSPKQTAVQEALEEAGVKGEIEDDPIGSYLHPSNKTEELQEIQLFPMLVTKQLDDWQEKEQRFRHWALLPETKRLLASKPAANLAVALQRRILFGEQPEPV